MKASHEKTFQRPRITLSYWLALSSALISFAIVSNQLFFATFIALGAILLKCIAPAAPKALRYSAQLSFTLAAYLYALLPLWPESYSDYYYSPIILLSGVALIAAFNRHSYGGSRGVTSIAAIAFLLFIRNILLYFEFKAPLQELALGLAFVGLMEIAISPRFTRSQDNPHPELVFGLLVALVASFSFTSLALGLVLASLPVISFLVRNHELAKIPNEHARPATRLSPAPRRSKNGKTIAALASIPLLAALALYLTVLQVPFWGNFLPSNAPYLAQSIAQKAAEISESSNLQDEAISDVASKVVVQNFIKGKATELADAWTKQTQDPEPQEKSQSERPSPYSQNQTRAQPQTRPYDIENFEYRLGPFARNRALQPSGDNTDSTGESSISSTFPRLSEPANSRSAESDSLNTPPPPTPEGLTQGIPNGLDTDFSGFSYGPGSGAPDSYLPSSAETSPREITQNSYSSDAATPDFDRFLNDFEQPEKAITQALNLEGNDVSALLSEEALAIVKLDSSRSAPRRLYLRSNVLDTVDKYGMGGIRDEQGRVELPVADDKPINLRSFRQSKSEGANITITSNQSRSPTLPLPESFRSIQILNTETLTIYPEERVALAPRSQEPITYHVYQADLEITDRERTGNPPSEEYRERMLEVPLNAQDRNYLEKLAKRVGGSRSPTRQFAYRFANYFANRHPYSYFVSIPRGPGHSVVRWLESESPGLCSNYAAAFTLLARSRGIPARVVGGFASDEFDSKENRFIMRQSNAHAWVEYLDESNNWVRFDPTPGISEAEIIRAEQYVTAGNRQSLQRLISTQAEAMGETIAAPTAEPTFPDPSDWLLAEDSSPSETISKPNTPSPQTASPLDLPQSQPSQSPPPAWTQQTNSPVPEMPAATEQSSPLNEPELATIPAPEPKPQLVNEETRAPISTTAEQQNPPWLVLLAILAIVIPGLAYLMRFKKTKEGSPEIQLRHQAGRLLAQLDSLLQQHGLSQDPIWIETRQTLTEQRYGREANPILVQDLAVKVALLSKRKKT